MNRICHYLCMLAIFFFPFIHVEGKKVNGWILLSDNMEYASHTIKAAKEYGINQLQLSHNIIHNLKEIRDEQVCNKVHALIDKAHQEGINEVLLWDHCLYSLDYYPDRFKMKESGLLDFDNPAFWNWLKADYRQMLHLVEKADGLILTFIETGAYAEKQHSDKMKTDAEKLAAVVNAVADVVVGEFNKKLYIRTFAYSEREYQNILGCINRLNRDDIILMMKETPHDFFLTHPNNKYVGKINRPTIVEFDTGNEYNGQGVIANTWPEYVMKRWAAFSQFSNVIGYAARTDRYGNTSIVGTANEILLYALKRQSENPKITPNQVYDEFILQEYGKKALPYLKKAFMKSFDIVTSILYTLGINTAEHSSLNYADYAWSYCRHVPGRWVNPPIGYVGHNVNQTFDYWRDVVNHIAPVKFKRRSSVCYQEIMDVFDKGWIDGEERMDATYYKYIVTEKRYGVQLAKEALAEIEHVKKLLPIEKYNRLYQLFERTYLTAQLHEAVCSVYFGDRVLHGLDSSQSYEIKQEIQAALGRMEHVIKQIQEKKETYPIGQFDWGRDADIAFKSYLLPAKSKSLPCLWQ